MTPSLECVGSFPIGNDCVSPVRGTSVRLTGADAGTTRFGAADATLGALSPGVFGVTVGIVTAGCQDAAGAPRSNCTIRMILVVAKTTPHTRASTVSTFRIMAPSVAVGPTAGVEPAGSDERHDAHQEHHDGAPVDGLRASLDRARLDEAGLRRCRVGRDRVGLRALGGRGLRGRNTVVTSEVEEPLTHELAVVVVRRDGHVLTGDLVGTRAELATVRVVEVGQARRHGDDDRVAAGLGSGHLDRARSRPRGGRLRGGRGLRRGGLDRGRLRRRGRRGRLVGRGRGLARGGLRRAAVARSRNVARTLHGFAVHQPGEHVAHLTDLELGRETDLSAGLEQLALSEGVDEHVMTSVVLRIGEAVDRQRYGAAVVRDVLILTPSRSRESEGHGSGRRNSKSHSTGDEAGEGAHHRPFGLEPLR